jgi:hypothetical protein
MHSCGSAERRRFQKQAKVAVGLLILAAPLVEALAQETAQRTGSIAGRVTDQQGAPVADVRIFLWELRTTAVTRANGEYVLGRVIAEFTPAGAVVATRQLHRRLHRQPEGIAFLGDSAVLISDEGGEGRATLSLYPRVQ